ncbi:reticulocyte-binding protein PFD0110w [Drosophila mauritiana]|uniref:Reticulocyte-binding protein PFD0110w n=1 Tax=Drosophila mauritiana TaxID=7226 RepID=A0A6P8JYA7_DROMA|nr:reticulocyte-binding protein PFD0110w [Drosophila mauritiana]
MRHQENIPESGSASSTSKASSETDLCEDYDYISKWNDKQLKINDQLRDFQLVMDSIKTSFNRTTSIEKCCFYENNSMVLLIENVNEIDPVNQIQFSKDLSTNLKNILSKIKKTVVKAFNSCCENLRGVIEKVKGEVEEKVKDIELKYKEMDIESSKRSDGIRKKVKQLEGRMEAVKSSLDKLQKEMDKNDGKTNCGEELKEQIAVLDSNISTSKNEAEKEFNKLNNRLKEIKEKLWNQDKISDAFKKSLEDGAEITKNIIYKSKNNCGNMNSSPDKQIQKEDLINLKKKTENLQRLIINITNKMGNFKNQGSSTSFSVTLNTCMTNNAKLNAIQSLLQEMIKQQNQTCSKATKDMTINGSPPGNPSCSSEDKLKERLKTLQNESAILDDELKKFPKCCQKIDKLNVRAEQITNELQILNITYNNQIKGNTNKFNTLKDDLDVNVRRMGQINSSNLNNSVQKQVKELQSKVYKAAINLEALKETQDDFIKLMESTKHQKYSPNEMEKLRKDFEEFRLKILRQLVDYDQKKIQEPSTDARQREIRLQKIHDDVFQDMDKLNNTIQLQDKLKMKAQDEIKKQKTPSKLMLDCERKCKEMDKFDKLLNLIEEAKNLVKMKGEKTTAKPTQKYIPKKKKKNKPKPKPTRKWSGVMVGGIDFEPNRDVFHRRQRSVDRSKRDKNETKGEFTGSTIEDVFIQQCECNAQVSIASLLLVISAITLAKNTHDYGNIYNQIRAPPVKERCDDYNDISKWIAEQVKLSAQLRKFKRDQDAILSYFGKTPTLMTCRFYEEITLNRIVEKVNRINEMSGTQVEKLKSSGDLEKDVENVLPQITKFVSKGIKSCCENFTKLIENYKKDLNLKIKNLPSKLNEKDFGKLNENDSIQKNLGYIEKQVEEIRPLFEKLQKYFRDSQANSKCCDGLKESFKALENKLSLAKGNGYNQALKIENQLKELKDKIQENVKKTNVLKTTLGHRFENIKNILSICNQSYVHKYVSMDTSILLDLEKHAETLQKLAETLLKNLGGLDIHKPTMNLNVTLNTCQENNELLTNIQSKMGYLLEQNSKACFEGSPTDSENSSGLINKNCSSNEKLQNSIAELEKEIGILRKNLTNFPKCCQKIDDLIVHMGKLENMMKKMNQTYNDHLNANSNQLNSIKDGMDKSLRKISPIHDDGDTKNLQELARKLKKDLIKGSLTLSILKERQDDLLKDNNKNPSSLYSPDKMAGLKKDLYEFSQDIDGKLKDLELKIQSKMDAVKHLDTFNKEANQHLDKVKANTLEHKELDMRIKDQTENQIKQTNEMLNCTKKCSKINMMNDLMDQVEDMERIVK